MNSNNMVHELTLRERIAMYQLAALTSIYWERETESEFTNAEFLVKCPCKTIVEHADALIKELTKPKGTND